MGEPYLGEIFMGGWNFAPLGFALCNGQIFAISSNTALFSLLGTNFGGNGINTFALPDLRGRIPIHQGQGNGLSPYNVGQIGGEENHTLNTNEIPAHRHNINANGAAPNTASPNGAYFAGSPATGSGPNASTLNTYTTNGPDGSLFNANAIATTGGSQPHNNIQPYLGITYVIATQGIFPARN